MCREAIFLLDQASCIFLLEHELYSSEYIEKSNKCLLCSMIIINKYQLFINNKVSATYNKLLSIPDTLLILLNS